MFLLKYCMIILLIIITSILSAYFVLVTILSTFHELNPCVFSINKWGSWDIEDKHICKRAKAKWRNGEGNGNPLQYSCLENPVGRGAWGAAVHRVAQSWTWLKRLSMHACIGEGNGNPLQCSCLENPRDGGAWWAAICGVTQSWTRLKRLSSSSSSICCSLFSGTDWQYCFFLSFFPVNRDVSLGRSLRSLLTLP